jgi:farnesyl-diphosphate farnesyltransferase
MKVRELELTSAEKKYLDEMMNKVSRSFAIVVLSLEEPLNAYMATAYLICRVVDNIEDCAQPFAWKQQRFQEFHQLIEEPVSAPQILAAWSQELWPGLTQDELEMMGPVRGLILWEIYVQLPGTSRSIIRRWTSEMADGMLRIENPDQHPLLANRDGVRVLAAESDYNAYCFYVAGTVGHMATELVVDHYGLAEDAANRLSACCEACGRGLQKTNILKDFAEDLGRGISYLPYTWHREADFAPLSLAGAPVQWKKMVIDDVVRELHDATEYVLALPYHAAGYRMASLMSLLPAYQTLLVAAKRLDTLFTTEHHVKISRPTMAKCQWDAHAMLADDDAVRRYSRRLEGEIDAAMARPFDAAHNRSAAWEPQD